MTSAVTSRFDAPAMAQPILHQPPREIQPAHTVRQVPIALSTEVRGTNAEMLNQILVDSVMLYQMYKKHHWQVLGPTFYQLHLLFDMHAEEQRALIDLVAERVQTLGGVAVAMPHDVAERTKIARPLPGAETPPVMLSRLLAAHEVLIGQVRAAIETTERNQDWGTNDLLMSDVLRTHEKQVWFVSSHLVDLPLADARQLRSESS